MSLIAERRTRWRNQGIDRVAITLLFALIVAAVLTVLWPTTQSMVETWHRSSTYSHCYLVIPIALWAVWHRSVAVAGVSSSPFWPGLVLIAALGVAWLLGELASVAVVSEFAAIGIVIATVLTVLGVEWTKRLAFPLALLLFAVPFGEALMPVLIGWTADVTVAALRLSAVPVYREASDFVTPNGSWSIVEACAGVRYLIAALLTGCLFAWLQYSSLAKRVTFVVLALVVALLANWLRSYTIVLLTHLSKTPVDSGVDHNTWGWVIFATAMFVLFAGGARWADSPQQLLSDAPQRSIGMQAIMAPLIASLLVVAAWPAAAAWAGSRADIRPVTSEAIAARHGWQSVSSSNSGWSPELVGPSVTNLQTFVHDGVAVSVYVGIYRNQRQGAELGSTTNKIVATDIDPYRLTEIARATVELNGQPTAVRALVARNASQHWLVWRWYWLEGYTTSSDFQLKLRLAMRRLLGQSDTGAWVQISTPVDGDLDAAARRLQAFVDAMSVPIDAALQATAAR